MIREFGNANIPIEDVPDIRPQPDDTPIVMGADVIREEPAMRPFHSVEEDQPNNNIAKIMGGVVVGLLVVGGGIYAYQTSSAPAPARQKIAMNTPARAPVAAAQPANPPAVAPPATAPDSTAAPFQTSPDGNSPTPSRTANSSNGTSSPAPVANDPINAPMTLTPDNAPPPQQSAPGSEAMQQPIAAPSVTAQTAQPSPEIANNAMAGAKPPSDTAQTAPVEQAPQPVQPATPAQ